MSKNESGGERAFESFTIPKWPPEVRVEKMVANRNDRLRSHSEINSRRLKLQQFLRVKGYNDRILSHKQKRDTAVPRFLQLRHTFGILNDRSVPFHCRPFQLQVHISESFGS